MNMQEITSYQAPRRLEEALQAMADGEATVFCGGTDLAPQTESGARQYKAKLLNLRRIEGLEGIDATGAEIRIGAATTISTIRRNAALADIAPALVEAAEHFRQRPDPQRGNGGRQHLQRVAGRRLDSTPLLALDAAAELACWRDGAVQTRRVPLEAFFGSPGKTVRRAEELLTAVVFDRPSPDFVSLVPQVGPASRRSRSPPSRSALGGPLRRRPACATCGSPWARSPRRRCARAMSRQRSKASRSTLTAITAAVEATAEDAKPIDDVRASAWYRGHLARVFVEEVLHHVLAEAEIRFKLNGRDVAPEGAGRHEDPGHAARLARHDRHQVRLRRGRVRRLHRQASTARRSTAA
jgi:xanthine dehydrogenase FAD-binding subunit